MTSYDNYEMSFNRLRSSSVQRACLSTIVLRFWAGMFLTIYEMIP